jgi:photosystem II stability/assembly factor-like uncharacterized protein
MSATSPGWVNFERDTWVSLQSDTTIDANSGWVWLDALGTVTLSHTLDGGASWTDVSNPCGQVARTSGGGLISFMDPQGGWAACGGIPATYQQQKWLQRTTDGGQTWNLVSEGSIPNRQSRVAGQMPWGGHVLPLKSSLAFADEQHGWLGTNRGGLFVTTDGGQSWEHRQVAMLGEEFIISVQLLGLGTGMVLADYGPTNVLWASRDNGLTWTKIYPAP